METRNGNEPSKSFELVPTRWGNQLNGNYRRQDQRSLRQGSPGSHSLGKSIEWKREKRDNRSSPQPHQVPTRWGNQLNGN